MKFSLKHVGVIIPPYKSVIISYKSLRSLCLTVLELSMPVVPPKSPGSMIITFTPNIFISSRKTSEKASTAYFAAPYTAFSGRHNRPLALVTFITLPGISGHV